MSTNGTPLCSPRFVVVLVDVEAATIGVTVSSNYLIRKLSVTSLSVITLV